MNTVEDIPATITIPNRVETRLGMLRFTDGFPDDATVQNLYDNLDFQRGVQAFLAAMPAASLVAIRRAIRTFGPDNQTLLITETLLDPTALALTANTETVYAIAWLDLRRGPVVIESPPNTLGVVDDFWFHYVADLGNLGPDQGQGGKFLFLPPDYAGTPPPGYYTFKSPTYNNGFVTRGFIVDGDPRPTVENFKKQLRLYPLALAANPPAANFINISGKFLHSLHAMDFSFFAEVNEVVQEEPNTAADPETLGLLAAIGIEQGKPFAPDVRMNKILSEAAVVGNATARAITFRSRLKEAFYYPNSAWTTPYVGGSHVFARDGVRLLDARALFFFYSTIVTPAMAAKHVGVGSQYAAAFVDSLARPLDGGKYYALHLPPNIPARNFWSLVVYDNQIRSMLPTDQPFPSIGSQKPGVVINPDTSVDIYFGPKPLPGKENNWIQTIPGKGWNVILRLYGPLEAWFDKSWQPGEIEPVSVRTTTDLSKAPI